MRWHSRRQFLRDLGLGTAAGLALPYLPLTEAEAQGGGAAMPRRLIIYITGNGVMPDDYFPRGSEAITARKILQPLKTHESDLLLVDGLEHKVYSTSPGRDHVKAKWTHLTGVEMRGDGEGNDSVGGASIDQLIAGRLGGKAGYPAGTMNIGDTGQATGAGSKSSGSKDPGNLFDSYFSQVRETADPQAEREAERINAARRRVFDVVRSRIDAVKPKIGAEDRRRFQEHLENIDQVQTQMQRQASLVCDKPDRPRGGGQETNIPVYGQLAVAALRCDARRIVVMNAGLRGDQPIPWLGVNNMSEHDLEHDAPKPVGHKNKEDPNSASKRTKILTWESEQFGKLLDGLSVREADGSRLLDNTLVVWVNRMATGNHRVQRVPTIIAGGANLGVRTGRILKVSNGDTSRSYNDLWVSVARLMGVDIDSFGSRAHNSGPLPTLG